MLPPRSIARRKLDDRYSDSASSMRSSQLSSQSASTELTTVTPTQLAATAAAERLPPPHTSSERELDMLTSTPLVLEPVDVF